jgi:hypothetical protein
MKKSRYISLVLITAALASCNRHATEIGDGEIPPEEERNNVYMRSDTTDDYTPVNVYNYYGNNMWWYAFRPYYGYYNGGYCGYYNNSYFGWYGNYYFPHYFHHSHYGPHRPGYYNHHAGNNWHYGPHRSTGGFGHRSSSGSHSTAS